MWRSLLRPVVGALLALLLTAASTLDAVELLIDGQWPTATTTATAVTIWPADLAPLQVSALNRYWMIPPQGGMVVVGYGVGPVAVALAYGPGTYQFYYDYGVWTGLGAAYATLTGTALTVVAVPSSLTLSPVPARPATASALAVSATVLDQFGGSLATEVSWSVTAGLLNVATGPAVTWTLPAAEGQATITAAIPATALTASASVDTRVSPRITQQPQVRVLNARDVQLSVRADDDGPASALTYRWDVVQGLASQVRMLSADQPARELDLPAIGSAVAQDLTVRVQAPGTFGFRAVVTDAEGHQTTSTAVQVTIAAVVTAVQVSPLSATLPLNGTQALTVQVQDQFGQPITAAIDYRLDPVTYGSVTADGVFHAPGSAGSVSVIATAGGNSSSSLITVANTAPVITSLALAPAPVTGTTAAATAVASDDGTAANALTWQWSATGPASITAAPATAAVTVLTFAKVGTYTVSARAQDAGGLWSAARVTTVSVDPRLSVTLSPLAVRRNPGTTQAFTATQRDQFGDLAATGSTVAWTVSGTGAAISPAGVLTLSAAAVGPVTVTATLASGARATAAVTVNAAPVVAGITIVPRQFIYQPDILAVAQASDDAGGALGYRWSLTGAPATTMAALGGDRLLITTQQAGALDLQCQVTDGDGRTTTAVAATERRVLEVDLGQAPSTFLLSSEVFDQFLRPMAAPPVVTWTAPAAVGRIVNGSTLEVGSTPGGPYAVTATCGSATESIAVRITAPPIAIDAPAQADPSPVLGTTTTVTVAAHAVTPLSYQWTATGPAAVTFAAPSAATSTATFSRVGTYTLAVALQAPGLATVSSTTAVTVVAVPSLTASTAVVTLGQGVTLTALADQFGTPATGVTWSTTNGTVTGDGVATLTPTAAGTCTVTATWAGVTVPLTATVAVNAPPQVALAAPAPVTGTAVLLQPTISDANDPLATLAIAWQNVGNASGMTLVTAGAPLGAATAAFTAPGSYPVRVVVTDPQGASATAAATIVVQDAPTTITASPATISLAVGASATAAVVVQNQFAQAIGAPAVEWSTTGGGTLAGAGATATYTATAAGAWQIDAAASATVRAQILVTVTPPPVVEAPVVDRPAGTYTEILSVVASCPTPSATIRYTLDGTDPSEASAAVAGSILVDRNATLTLRAFRAGWTTSAPVVVAYAFTTASPTASVPAGTYGVEQSVTLACATPDSTIHFTVDGSLPTASSPTVSGAIAITRSTVLTAVAVRTGWTTGPGAVLTYTLRCADPVWTVAPGAVASGTVVNATTTTADATITVTVDGSDPTATSPALPLTLTASQTLRCRTIKPGWEPSAVVEGVFTVNDHLPTVSFTVARVERGIFSGDSMTLRVVTDGPTTQDIQVPIALMGAMREGWTAYLMDPWMGYAQDLTLTLPASPSAPASAEVVVYVQVYYLTAAGVTGRLEMGTPVHAVQGPLTQVDLVVLPNLAPEIASVTATPSPVNGGTTARLMATVTDDGGAAGLNCIWVLVSGPAGVTFSDNDRPEATSTTAAFVQTGHYELRCDVMDGYGYWAGPRQGASAALSVDVLPVCQVTVDHAVVNPGATLQARLTDQFGASLGAVDRWEATSGGIITSDGLFTAGAEPGMVTIRAFPAGGGDPVATTIRINAAPRIVSLAAEPAPVLGTTTTLRLTVADDDDLATVVALWSLPDSAPHAVLSGNGQPVAPITATFNRAGAYPFTVVVTDPLGLSATTTLSVTVQAVPSLVTVSPATSVVQAGATAAFTALVQDQFNQEILGAPVNWSATAGAMAGTSTEGVLTAGGTSGIYVLSATAGAVTGHATVRVNTPPVIASVTVSPDPVVGLEGVVTATVTDDLPASKTTLDWKVLSGPDDSQVYPRTDGRSAVVTFATVGDYRVRVVAKDGDGGTVASERTISVHAQPMTAELAAEPVPDDGSGSVRTQYAAVVRDQFGEVVESATVLWSISGPGSIDEHGLFTQSAEAGAVIVTATIQGTSVTVSAEVPGTSGPGTGGHPPVVPTSAVMTVTSGLTGVRQALLDGHPASFTKETTVTVRVVPSGQAPVLRVDLLGATGTASANDPGRITLSDLPEGTLHLGAVVTVGTTEESASATFTDLLTLVVDRTPPVVTRTVIGGAEIAPSTLVRLNANTAERCAAYRTEGLYCFPADLHAEEISVQDEGSGLTALVPKVRVRRGEAQGTEIETVKWGPGVDAAYPMRERTVQAGGWNKIPDTVEYQDLALTPESAVPAQIAVELTDRCGNIAVAVAHPVSIKKAPPIGRMAALPYQETGPLVNLSSNLQAGKANQYDWFSSTSLLNSSVDVWRLSNAGSLAGINKDEHGKLASIVWTVPATVEKITAVDGHGNEVNWSIEASSPLNDAGFPQWTFGSTSQTFGISLSYRHMHRVDDGNGDYRGWVKYNDTGNFTGICAISTSSLSVGPVPCLESLALQPIDTLIINVTTASGADGPSANQLMASDNAYDVVNSEIALQNASADSQGGKTQTVEIPLISGRLLCGYIDGSEKARIIDWSPGRGANPGTSLRPGTWSQNMASGGLFNAISVLPVYSGSGSADAEQYVYGIGEGWGIASWSTKWTVTPSSESPGDLSSVIKQVYSNSWGIEDLTSYSRVWRRVSATQVDEAGWPSTPDDHSTWIVGNPGSAQPKELLLAPAAWDPTTAKQPFVWRSPIATTANMVELIPDGFGQPITCAFEIKNDAVQLSADLKYGFYRRIWSMPAVKNYHIPAETIKGQRIGDISMNYSEDIPVTGPATVAQSATFNQDEVIYSAEEKVIEKNFGLESQVLGFQAIQVAGVDKSVVMAGSKGVVTLRSGTARVVGIIDPDNAANLLGSGDAKIALGAALVQGAWEDPLRLTNPEVRIALEVGAQVKPKLYHIDLDLGADPANAEQLEGLGLKIRSGVYRVKDALSVCKVQLNPVELWQLEDKEFAVRVAGKESCGGASPENAWLEVVLPHLSDAEAKDMVRSWNFGWNLEPHVFFLKGGGSSFTRMPSDRLPTEATSIRFLAGRAGDEAGAAFNPTKSSQYYYFIEAPDLADLGLPEVLNGFVSIRQRRFQFEMDTSDFWQKPPYGGTNLFGRWGRVSMIDDGAPSVDLRP
ncbi:MAG: chitobiase/beta-hexosaminidase C-terminal domain-containing protein, partial [Planctomycetes bacterium]|nr:chitobiase/beta-hexosaminidase C-terminal domain-containing protein [Planctomycetota bacterium]